MEADQGKRRGRSRKAVDGDQPIVESEVSATQRDPDGQGRQERTGEGAASPTDWSEALSRLEAVPNEEIITLVEVPFDEHPEHYTRLHYGAVVVTGDKFTARTTNGDTIQP